MKKQNDALTLINEFINDDGSQTADEIVDMLVDRLGISRENAIQKIQYYKKQGKLFSSYPLRFHNGQFAYSKKNSNNCFWYSVMRHKEYLYNVIEKFKENNYIISFYEIGKLTGCLFLENKKYLTISKVIEEIKYFYEIKTITKESNYFVIGKKIFNDYENEICELKTKLTIDCILIPSIIYYLQSINLISDKPLYRNKSNPFNYIETNNLAWDIVAYSTTTGLTLDCLKTELSPKTLVFVDVKMHDVYGREDYLGLKTRIDKIIYSTKGKRRRVLPIVFINKISEAALKECKKNNYIIIDMAKVFGKAGTKVVSFIREGNINNVGNYDEMLDILEKAGMDETFKNIKGYIFEMLTEKIIRKICVYKKQYYIKTNVEVTNDKGEKAELDIVLKDADDKRVIFECKSSRKKIYWENYIDNELDASSYAKYFFNRTAGILDNKYGKGSFKMSMVAANGFDAKVINKTKKQALLARKSTDFELLYDIKDLIIECENILKENSSSENIKKEKEIIEKYFINEVF